MIEAKWKEKKMHSSKHKSNKMRLIFCFLLLVFVPSSVFSIPKPKSGYLLIKLPDSSSESHHGDWKPPRGGHGGKVYFYVAFLGSGVHTWIKGVKFDCANIYQE